MSERKARSALERVLARLGDPPKDECWIWPGALYSNGYGHVGGPGRGGGSLLVHVVVYEGLVGPVPEGKELDHLCRNRACCNPYKCLEPVSHQLNVLRGAKTKLRVGDVIAILTRARRGESQKSLSAEFGIRPATVSQIVNRKRWRHVHCLKGIA